MSEPNRGVRASDAVVGAIIGAFIIYLTWVLLPQPWLKWSVIGVGLYEAWTITNRFANDTLSESVARLTTRQPLVPLLFGIAIGWGIGLGWLDPNSVAVGLLAGHWFFTMERKAERIEERKVEEAAATGLVPGNPGPLTPAA